MATTSQPNQESRELTRLFHQIKNTLTILSYKDMTDESVKPELDKFTGYEANLESPPFSAYDANDASANLISVTAPIQDPKYHVNPCKLVIWLRRFIKAHSVDYSKESCLEDIHLTQQETTDLSLKHRLWFLKFQGTTQ